MYYEFDYLLSLSTISHFYLHIPFCRQKCPYCKFALTPVFDDAKKKRYLAHLRNEICEYFSTPSPHLGESKHTLYFGGGTPSVLSLDELGEILECLPFSKTKNLEFSFECNPEDVTPEYIRGLCEMGVNRISLGIQSLNNRTLDAVHRCNKEHIFFAGESIAGVISSIDSTISLNVDFILGLPFSKPGEILKSIDELYEQFPTITHTSVYMLEDGHYPKSWKNHSLNEIEIEREYGDICDLLQERGWHHYELSNWAKPGFECLHNQAYWNHEDYHGFGLSATSYNAGRRTVNAQSFSGYYQGEKSYEEILTPEELSLEQRIYNLRTFRLAVEGFDRERLESLVNMGFITIRDKKILLTSTGILRENFIMSELMEMRE